MEIRVKYITANNAGYYAVQVKKHIFWKTIYTNDVFTNVEKFIDTLAQIDDFNNKTKSLNKIVYNGWAVRNVYKNTGPSYSISFFDSYPSKCETDHKSELLWRDIDGGIVPTMEIKTKKLFGKECFEPMRLRITIEQIKD